jgi:hypothetical protein
VESESGPELVNPFTVGQRVYSVSDEPSGVLNAHVEHKSLTYEEWRQFHIGATGNDPGSQEEREAKERQRVEVYELWQIISVLTHRLGGTVSLCREDFHHPFDKGLKRTSTGWVHITATPRGLLMSETPVGECLAAEEQQRVNKEEQ